MADITTPRELFIHELGDILYVEQKLTQEVLPKLIEEVQSDELRNASSGTSSRPAGTSRTSSRSST